MRPASQAARVERLVTLYFPCCPVGHDRLPFVQWWALVDTVTSRGQRHAGGSAAIHWRKNSRAVSSQRMPLMTDGPNAPPPIAWTNPIAAPPTAIDPTASPPIDSPKPSAAPPS